MPNTTTEPNLTIQSSTIRKPKKVQQETFSQICAVIAVSESEIQALFPDYSAEWETKTPAVFKSILWDFGLNVNQEYNRQDFVQHRNRMNKQVLCSRWVGNERYDSEWLNSGLASKECLDRAKNNRLLDDLYRAKNMTVDMQSYLEQKDSSAVKGE